MKNSKERVYKEIFLKAAKLTKKPEPAVLHKKSFRDIHCLICANCCKTTPAIVTKEDINRISKEVNMSAKNFFKTYVLEDINGELSFKTVPCVFLKDNNECAIYDVRPKACREFPHIDDIAFYKRPLLNAKNVYVCPAVQNALDILQKLIETHPEPKP